MMKKTLLAALAALAFSISIFAQTGDEEVDAIIQKIQKHRTILTYEYVISGVTEVKVNGTATIQGECFRMEGAGLLIMCDSQSIWTLDLNGKEAYVEKAGPMDYMKYLRQLEYKDGKLEGSYVEPMSGAIIPFTISDIKYLPSSGDLKPFSPAEDTFASGDWIITDLR